MASEFRVQFENDNGSVLFIAFQTTTIERANELRNELTSLLNDRFSLDHTIATREYHRNADDEWVLVNEPAQHECKTEHNYMDYKVPSRYSL